MTPLAFTSVELPTWKPPAFSAWIRFVTLAVAESGRAVSPASDAGGFQVGNSTDVNASGVTYYSLAVRNSAP